MILNLTQHSATPEQINSGVVDLPDPVLRQVVAELLTFDQPPRHPEIAGRAADLAMVAVETFDLLSETVVGDDGPRFVMIGGALWLMAPLARALRALGLEPVFAFSSRETVEETQPDGSVRKVAVFRHRGWVPAL